MVKRKAKASRIRAAKQASYKRSNELVVQRSDGSSSSSSPEPKPDIDFISSSPSECPEDNSVCYFMANYVMVRRHPETSKGFVEHLVPFYSRTSSNSPLAFATTATALLSTRYPYVCPPRAAIKARALLSYVEALRLIKVAIQDPQEAKSDSLLMAVLLLGLYEVGISLIITTRLHKRHTEIPF